MVLGCSVPLLLFNCPSQMSEWHFMSNNHQNKAAGEPALKFITATEANRGDHIWSRSWNSRFYSLESVSGQELPWLGGLSACAMAACMCMCFYLAVTQFVYCILFEQFTWELTYIYRKSCSVQTLSHPGSQRAASLYTILLSSNSLSPQARRFPNLIQKEKVCCI